MYIYEYNVQCNGGILLGSEVIVIMNSVSRFVSNREMSVLLHP